MLYVDASMSMFLKKADGVDSLLSSSGPGQVLVRSRSGPAGPTSKDKDLNLVCTINIHNEQAQAQNIDLYLVFIPLNELITLLSASAATLWTHCLTLKISSF